MTCKDCLHCEVCEDNGSDFFKSGAENCTFYLNEKQMLEQFCRDLIKHMSNHLYGTKRIDRSDHR